VTPLEQYRKALSDATAAARLADVTEDDVERARLVQHAASLRGQASIYGMANGAMIAKLERAEQVEADRQAAAEESTRVAQLRPLHRELARRQQRDPVGALIFARAKQADLAREDDDPPEAA
jgi:hypothetical protein